MITKLVAYHANPAYHVGYETANIAVAHKLTQKNEIRSYEQYFDLCQSYGIVSYNRDVWRDHEDNKPYKP